ncbi:siderophore-interacting protein [Paenibacillus qinlingensis]|uniref:NADPH-dependent ferric siderophore reductase n=1 Tax=Paenibacillus qinlingensis TaxID=1837343 RepID=A0ABU1P3U3_9BACL|nr:siderophore-interacting protein [Paenibacillus qinlingensis]MDR6554425.1 NADPH-dependent ferric siderophore reductase [Paenibacillus qinlingensis]
MGILENLGKRISHKATVIQKQQIAEHTFRISLQLQQAKGLSYTPGEFLRVLVGADQSVKLTDMIRTYSVWRYDTASQVIEIAACTFSSGSGASWAKRLQNGDTVHFTGPKGNFVYDESPDYYILIGDISSLAHLYEIHRQIPPHKKVFSLIYADHKQDFFTDLDGTSPLTFYNLPANPVQSLTEQLELIMKQAQGKGMLYVGGDGRVCVEMRNYMKMHHQWENRQIKAKPFWMPGKKGLE